MQCDNCGKEVSGIEEFPNIYGFRFCSPLDVDIKEESCEDKFERKLWEAAREQAQANKKAERKTEASAGQIGFDTFEVVDAIGSDRGKIALPNLRRTDKEFYRPSKRSHPTGERKV